MSAKLKLLAAAGAAFLAMGTSAYAVEQVEWVNEQLAITDGFTASDYHGLKEAMKEGVAGRPGEIMTSTEGPAGAVDRDFEYFLRQLETQSGGAD